MSGWQRKKSDPSPGQHHYDRWTDKSGAVWYSGRVERVVPGRLVYVAFSPKQETQVFKLDNLLIQQANGTFSGYAGEPFSQLGLTVGSSVKVVTTNDRKQANVVFNPLEQSSFTTRAKDFFRTD
jgi:hypothetical protein